MSEVKWIKIKTDMFMNPKIKHLRTLPDGNDIVLTWVMLLTLAGRCNADGMIFLTEKIPYSTKMLAEELNFSEKKMKNFLKNLENLGLIFIENDFIFVRNWEKHQNTDKLQDIREYNRIAQQKSRANRKALQNVNDTVNDMSMTCQPCQDTEEDKEEDKEERIKNKRGKEKIDCQLIADMYNRLCPSFIMVKVLSDSRKKAIRARLNQYSVEDFETMFKKAEASSFLKGRNARNWTANFDWMLKDSNMAKILEGNYDNKPETSATTSVGPRNQKSAKAQELDDFYIMAASWAEGEEGGS